MLNAILLVLDVIACSLLILFVLLHAGRGGGLSDMFGGQMGGSMAGSTVVERNLDRLTVIACIIFMFTTVLLALRLRLTARPRQSAQEPRPRRILWRQGLDIPTRRHRRKSAATLGSPMHISFVHRGGSRCSRPDRRVAWAPSAGPRHRRRRSQAAAGPVITIGAEEFPPVLNMTRPRATACGPA